MFHHGIKEISQINFVLISSDASLFNTKGCVSLIEHVLRKWGKKKKKKQVIQQTKQIFMYNVMHN